MPQEGKCFISGILRRIREITAFLNCTTNSYKRLGMGYAPRYVNWSYENRSQLIRIPRITGAAPKIEIRSADACCNPYIAFKLILAAGIEGIKTGDCSLMEKTVKNSREHSEFDPLPHSLEEAAEIARKSDFVRHTLPDEIFRKFFEHTDDIISRYKTAEDKDLFEENTYFKFI